MFSSGAYLYRKERKKRKGSNTNVVDAKIPFRPSSDDGSSCCSTTPGSVVQEEIPESVTSLVTSIVIQFSNESTVSTIILRSNI